MDVAALPDNQICWYVDFLLYFSIKNKLHFDYRSVCVDRNQQLIQRAPNRHAGAIHHGLRRAARRGGLFVGGDVGWVARRTAAALHHGDTCGDSVHCVYTGELCMQLA